MRGQRAGRRPRKPRDMRHNAVVGGIGLMAVRIPIGRTHMHFDVATQPAVARLDQERGIEKVRPGLQIPLARTENLRGFAAR